MTLNRRDTALMGGAALLAAAIIGDQSAQAQTPQTGDQQAVAQAIASLNKAMIDVDGGRLEALSADALSYGHSAGRIETKQQFVANVLTRNAMFRTINLSDETIAVVGTNAIARHLLTGETVNPTGQTTPVRIGVLQVWNNAGADWKLLARQAYRI